jgi:hypothetical protein
MYGERRHRAYHKFELLLPAYALGCFLLDERFCDLVIGTFRKSVWIFDKFPSLQSISSVWPQLPENCGMRRLLMDVVATCMRPQQVELDNLPEDVLGELESTWNDLSVDRESAACLNRRVGDYNSEEPDAQKGFQRWKSVTQPSGFEWAWR